MPEPGWYTDPNGSGDLRRWDGSAWTADVRPADPASTPLEATVVASASSAPPASQGAETTASRRWWVVGAVVLLLVVSGGLAYSLVAGDDAPPPLAADQGPATEDGSGGSDDTASDPTDLDAVEDDPPAPAPTEDAAAPSDTGAAIDDEDAISVVFSYVAALDRFDLEAAHAHLTSELAARPGWSLQAFENFWTGLLDGASVATVHGVRGEATRPTVDVTIDYRLQDGTTSREEVEIDVLERDGRFFIDRYLVVDTERLGG